MSEKDIRSKAEIKSEIDKNNAETEKLAAETRKEKMILLGMTLMMEKTMFIDSLGK